VTTAETRVVACFQAFLGGFCTTIVVSSDHALTRANAGVRGKNTRPVVGRVHVYDTERGRDTPFFPELTTRQELANVVGFGARAATTRSAQKPAGCKQCGMKGVEH
jgi:hypothetical protein